MQRSRTTTSLHEEQHGQEMQLTQEQLGEKMQQLAQEQYDRQTEQLNLDRWYRQRPRTSFHFLQHRVQAQRGQSVTSNEQYATRNAPHVTQQMPQPDYVVPDTTGRQKEHTQPEQSHQQPAHPTQQAQFVKLPHEERYDQKMQLTQEQHRAKMQQLAQVQYDLQMEQLNLERWCRQRPGSPFHFQQHRVKQEEYDQQMLKAQAQLERKTQRNFEGECHSILMSLQNQMQAQRGQPVTSNEQYATQKTPRVTQQMPQPDSVVPDTTGLQKEHTQPEQMHQQLAHPTQQAQSVKVLHEERHDQQMQPTHEQLGEKMQQPAQEKNDQQLQELQHNLKKQYAAQDALHVTQQMPQLDDVVSDTMGLQKEHTQLEQLHQQLAYPTQQAQLLHTILEDDREQQEEYDQQMLKAQAQLERNTQHNFEEECHSILMSLQNQMQAQRGQSVTNNEPKDRVQDECHSLNDLSVDSMTHVGEDAIAQIVGASAPQAVGGIGADAKTKPKDRLQDECRSLKDLSVENTAAGG